ncbi:MAG: hydantoinase/oxoprolinase family protein [Longimicrobiales bacterium]|nr:hydantoinase/oxoprolinase family protein [Longimicrobiales bacterium]
MSLIEKGKISRIISVDTGGTFTDFLFFDNGHLKSLKIPSTPADPAEAVLEGINTLLGQPAKNYILLHGSTVSTNTVLERTGARVKLITNSGFEDIIEIGRQNRPQLYKLVGHRLPPLVSRNDRQGIPGRIGPSGDILEQLDANDLRELPQCLEDAESIAIVLLHSYANPEHEIQVEASISSLGIPVSVSANLLPEYREYERTSTTVTNAYIAPKMAAYLTRLEHESQAERVNLMGSNGGSLPVTRAALEPVHTLLSGPAGGVIGALAWSKKGGHDHIISFDMGGTSTDVSLCPGTLTHTTEFEIGGQAVAVPVLDIHTVGSGGGSLARMDPGGALKVGPQSAGADPGPICYGKGGEGVTVTDAHVWLGHLPTDGLLAGSTSLERSTIEPHLQYIASSLGCGLEEAAQGILKIADSTMERALRVISVEKGYDPSGFSLVAFGGAGGLHAASLADRLGAAKAIIPPLPGLLSAYGILSADITRETSKTVLIPSSRAEAQQDINTIFLGLEKAITNEMESEGINRESLILERWVEARYEGQSFELRVPGASWVSTFHTLHEERYGYQLSDQPVLAVTLRSVASAPGPEFELNLLQESSNSPKSTLTRVFLDGQWTEVKRIQRENLSPGYELPGPLVITEYSSTTWIPPNYRVMVDQWGSLHLTRIQ